ncbi:RDD family protein [Patulibacter sp. NPDC049589]|uniref:RDD family protein n=1 Tax=Patulibacter sp. NPDC049589 TaxID=3154731 RepID=UPI0034429B28
MHPYATTSSLPRASPALGNPGRRLAARLLDGLAVVAMVALSFGLWSALEQWGYDLVTEYHGDAQLGLVYGALSVIAVVVLVVGRRGGTVVQTAQVMLWPIAVWGVVLFLSTVVRPTYWPLGNGMLWPKILAAYAVVVVYAPVLLSRPGPHNGQTLGKQALGLRVVRDDGGPITLGRAIVREPVGTLLLAFVPFYSLIDALMVPIDRRHRSLHDMIASTLVTGPPEASASTWAAAAGPVPSGWPTAGLLPAIVPPAATRPAAAPPWRPQALPAPGWFPDPSDASRHRWWDGRSWTDHIG